MKMVVKRGIIVWISAFATFLAVMCSFATAVLLVNEGAGTVVNPYILGGIFSGLGAESYMWISVTATFILMGVTCTLIYLKQPPDPEIVKMFLKVGGNLAALRKAQETAATETADQLEYNRKVNQNFFGTIQSNLEEANKETVAFMANQKKDAKKTRLDLVSTIETKLAETGEKLSADLKKQGTVIVGVKTLNEESVASLKKQQMELKEIESRLERIEANMVPNQAALKSLDDPENIKGIGPSLGKELTSLGITSVGDFLTTDPAVIGEKTRVSQEAAENLQAMAQLMMVPGVDSNDAEILIDAGIKSRKDLANQDLIQLSKKVGDISRTYVNQGKLSKDKCPTIEKISYWIRTAR